MKHHPMHPEVLPLLVNSSGWWRDCQSSADALAQAFNRYGARRCLGTRVTTKEGEFGEYEWLSYSDVVATTLQFGAGLESLLLQDRGRKGFVGVLGAVCCEWLMSDLGCAFKGIGICLMHRATTPHHLAHIITSTQMAALVISRHLRNDLEEALRLADGSSLRHIVWFDDPAEAHAARAQTTPSRSKRL